MDYPNLLVLSTFDIWKDKNSVTFTVNSFLSGWPKDKIYQVVYADFNCPEKGQISKNTYVLEHSSISFASKIIPATRRDSTEIKVPVITKYNFSIKKYIRQFGLAFYQCLPYKIPSDLKKFLLSNNIDCIYSELSNIRSVQLTKEIEKLIDKPVIPHIMDDWPSAFLSNMIAPIGKTLLNSYLRIFFKNKKCCLCICDAMSEEYSKRYNVKTMSLMHSVNDISALHSKEKDSNRNILYAGSLYLDRYRSILLVAKEIKKQNLDFIINIAAPQDQWDKIKKDFEDYPFVCYIGFLSESQLYNQIANSFALLFVESFDENMLKFTRLSMSTKIPEYLSSGKPIIALGLPVQSSIKYLKDNNAAIIIEKNEDISSIFMHINNREVINEIVENARKLYETNHLKTVQSANFFDLVSDIVKSHRRNVSLRTLIKKDKTIEVNVISKYPNLRPICSFGESSIICLRRSSLCLFDTKSSKISVLLKLPNTIARKLFLRFNILSRRYGLKNIRGIQISDTKCLIWYHYLFYILNVQKKELNIIGEGNRYSLLNINESSIGPVWGEYGYNPSKSPKSIYRYNTEKNIIEILYTFPAGEINHIHNIIEDKVNNRFYILTGDFGESAAIYYTDDKFMSINKLIGGAKV